MMTLHGKKILFLTANFFNYEVAIIKRLKELGAEVDFFNERPSDSVFTKGIIRVKSSLYETKIRSYYQKILHKINNKNYDFFLLIKGETIPHFFLEEFAEKNPNATKIFYSYDAADEYPKFLKLYPYFDKNFTFEPKDAVKFNLHFRPLFFIDEYRNSPKKSKKEFHLIFIGSAHTDRYIIGEKVREKCNSYHLKTYFYYFAPGKTAFFLKKIFDKTLRKFDIKKLSFNKLSHQEIIGKYQKSFSVLDINKPFQNGLTMRTFEALASGRKLITTNSDIQKYVFYNPQNVLIIDRSNIQIPKSFFETEFQSIPEKTLEMMSLDSWLHCLFFENQDDFWNVQSFESH